jgi:hypothetical protein
MHKDLRYGTVVKIKDGFHKGRVGHLINSDYATTGPIYEVSFRPDETPLWVSENDLVRRS